MQVFKYIILGLIVALVIYLVIDTTVFVVKKIKEHKAKKKEINQDKTE